MKKYYENWGDIIPGFLIKKLSNSEKFDPSIVFNVKSPNKKYPIYSTGSVFKYVKNDSLVWGTGCIDYGQIGQKPKKIYSVRGPLTRNELQKVGYQCPEIYGDPALLFPLIYTPQNIVKKYKYGVIPHYIDYSTDEGLSIIKHLEKNGIKIIDICSGVYEFIDQLHEVENVISSSLHGLIASDAYNIPNSRIIITDKIIGGNFKFNDYYLSISREIDNGVRINKSFNNDDLKQYHFNNKIKFNTFEYLKSALWNFEENKTLFYG
jgi:pyruvyltransferase